MSWIVAHFLAKMHQKTMQFHILARYFDNMSFLTFKVVTLTQKILKISQKNYGPKWVQKYSYYSCAESTSSATRKAPGVENVPTLSGTNKYEGPNLAITGDNEAIV